MSDPPIAEIPLSEAIQSLRTELIAAMESGKDEPLQFSIAEVEVELRVGISRNAVAKGSLGFTVLGMGIGGEGSRGFERVHTVKLKLQPRLAHGDGAGTLTINEFVDPAAFDD